MRKDIRVIILLLFFVTALTACSFSQNKKSLEFKNEYEELNGKTNSSGKEYRNVTIPEDNPYVETNPKKIIEKIENKETFYLYVGDSLCPWCRSVIEKSIEVAKNNNIQTIYYIDIWDDNGNEIFRDKYELQNDNLVKVIEGTNEYYKLLDVLHLLLDDYTVTNSNGEKVDIGEKRIYAPNYFYIENGIAKKKVEGISEKQNDSRGELTKEILKDQEQIFKDFFSDTCSSNVC